MVSGLPRVVRLHAGLIRDAARLEAVAQRHQATDPDRAMQAADDAAECRATAAALADLLAATGAPVLIPDPRQMALLSDGGPL